MLRSVCVVALAAIAVPAFAQTAAPLLPLAGLHDAYWPLQMVQWLGPELPYSMITLYVDDRAKQPLYDVVLSERAGNKRIHYCNSPELLAADKRKGDEAYQVAIAFERPDSVRKGAQNGLRFNTEKGVPIVWQFVELTDMSEQGSGVTPIDAPFPMLLYREQGALAGEGTALKIGSVTSAADVWKEFAQPPYFVPYHGALTQGAHIVSLSPTASSWTGAQPASLTGGASWRLTGTGGAAVTAHVDTAKGQEFTVSFTSERGDAQTLDAAQTAGGWAVSRARLGPGKAKADQTVSLVFTPALTPGAQSKFDIIAGRKTKLGSGTVETGTDGSSERWSMLSPEALKGKSAAASATLTH